MANTPDTPAAPETGERLAKVIARSGLCSRRDAETWIAAGRVVVNGKKILTPAFNVTSRDKIIVDGAPLAARQGTRVWLYHKPAGLVVTEKDPEGRETIFEALEAHGLPRVVTVGRLDINTEGLILLTNDGGLKRVLELPATGWLRRYRVRAHGSVTQAALDSLKNGIEIEGIKYGAIEATLEREQGANVWLVMALREGKNREVKNVLGALGLEVNRLIRVSYGPFQLGDIPVGGIETVKAKTLRDQLGKKLAEAADVDFDSEMPEINQLVGKPTRDRRTGRGTNTVEIARERFRFTDRAEKTDAEFRAERPRQDRPGRFTERRPGPLKRSDRDDEEMAPPRRIHFEDGREPLEFKGKPSRKPASRDDQPARSFGKRPDRPARADGADRPKRPFGDRPRPPRPEGEARPARDFTDKPRGPRRDDANKPRGDFAGRPKREFGDRPPRRGDADRPKRPYGDRPRAARPEGEGRPAHDFTDKPRSPRREAAGTDRPKREYAPRPRPDGDRPGKPRGARPEGSESRGPAKPRTRPDGKPYPKRDGAAPPRGPRGGSKPGGRPAPGGSRRPKG